MKRNTQQVKNHMGFTLIEVLVTVSISAILLSIAVPNFTKMIKSNRVTAATNEVVAALMLARSEALKRNDNISICASTDLQTCSQSLQFEEGWIIFQDCNRNGVLETGANNASCVNNTSEKIIKVHDPLDAITLRASGGRSFLSYRFTGRSDTVTLYVREKGNSAVKKRIYITRTGRVRAN